MGSPVTVTCDWPSSLDDNGYTFSEGVDKSRNAIVVPGAVLDTLGIEECEYVEATSASNPATPGVILQILSFEDVPDDESETKASIRTNLMDEIPGDQPDERVILRKIEIDSPDEFLKSYPGYSDDIVKYDYCYLSDEINSEIGIEPGEYIESYNPQHGGRMPLKARKLRDRDRPDKIRMSGQARNVLQLETGDEVRVRECVHARPSQIRWWERILGWFVGFRELGLRVQIGRDRDEHRNAVRLSEDVMELLAVDPGDQIVLEWNGTPTSVRCLPPVEGDLESMGVKVPSTIRDRDGFDVSIHDSVHVRRNMLYILRKQVALSTLGILGVLIGSLQVAIYLELSTIQAVPLAIFTSFIVVWLLLLPERQRCAVGNYGILSRIKNRLASKSPAQK